MMRRILAKGLVVSLLCLFVPPQDRLRSAPGPIPVAHTPLAAARTLPPPSVRMPQKELTTNAALLLIMTVALRGLHGT